MHQTSGSIVNLSDLQRPVPQSKSKALPLLLPVLTVILVPPAQSLNRIQMQCPIRYVHVLQREPNSSTHAGLGHACLLDHRWSFGAQTAMLVAYSAILAFQWRVSVPVLYVRHVNMHDLEDHGFEPVACCSVCTPWIPKTPSRITLTSSTWPMIPTAMFAASSSTTCRAPVHPSDDPIHEAQGQ